MNKLNGRNSFLAEMMYFSRKKCLGRSFGFGQSFGFSEALDLVSAYFGFGLFWLTTTASTVGFSKVAFHVFCHFPYAADPTKLMSYSSLNKLVPKFVPSLYLLLWFMPLFEENRYSSPFSFRKKRLSMSPSPEDLPLARLLPPSCNLVPS